ncbi:MAG: hypothetical protein AAF674_16420, partial [Pseudomonadota bacterium]
LNAELVEQRPLRNLPRPHHPLDPPVLGSIESGAHSYFKARFFNTIRQNCKDYTDHFGSHLDSCMVKTHIVCVLCM